jgi:hypothetical protein
MKQEIVNRLEYVEETYAGELETWHDPVADTYYHVPISIDRNWDESEALLSHKPNTMTHERKEEHIRNIAFCIRDGASGYVTDNFRIEDLPVPQRAGTMTQQDTYSKHRARQIFEAFLEQNPNIND